MPNNNDYYITEEELERKYPTKEVIAFTPSNRVCLATYKKLNMDVVLKLTQIYRKKYHHEDLATFNRRFAQEAAIATQLKHPNIVKVFDFGYFNQLTDEEPFTQPIHFMVMEYVNGPNLNEALYDLQESKETLSLEEKLLLFDEICDPVIAAHKTKPQQVIHRDLKPGNILIGKNGELKIFDWGIAKIKPSENSETMDGSSSDHLNLSNPVQTQDQLLRCTPSYAAPEQINGTSSDIDVRTDVYALGGILYHLITGRPPFESEDLGKRLGGNHDFFIPDALPQQLKDIITRATEVRNKDRFRSVRQLRTAVRLYHQRVHEGKKGFIYVKDVIKKLAKIKPA